MSQRNNYTLYDYFLIAIVILLIIISLFVWQLNKKTNRIKELEKLILNNDFKQEVKIANFKRLDSLEAVKRDTIEVKVKQVKKAKKKTIAFYKSQHETLNHLSDSSQYFSIDSILAECRDKPFKRD